MTSSALRREARKVCPGSATWQTLLALPEHIKDTEDVGKTAACDRWKYQKDIKN
jgi:hypothetical protein